jgi:hypothetical protein
MPQTYLQTAVIERLSTKGNGIVSTKYELIEAPIAPYGTNAIKQADGTRIYWAPHCIYSVNPDDIFITWFNKPTFEHAYTNKNYNANYYQFNSDDTVIQRFKTTTGSTVELWWSPPIMGTITYGEDISTLIEPEI